MELCSLVLFLLFLIENRKREENTRPAQRTYLTEENHHEVEGSLGPWALSPLSFYFYIKMKTKGAQGTLDLITVRPNRNPKKKTVARR